jgi:hypothetical protein
LGVGSSEVVPLKDLSRLNLESQILTVSDECTSIPFRARSMLAASLT